MAFAQRRGLDKHRLTHAQANIACELCGKLVKSKDSLDKHLKTAHTVDMEDQVTEDGLTIKVKIPKPRKAAVDAPGPCEACGKVFMIIIDSLPICSINV